MSVCLTLLLVSNCKEDKEFPDKNFRKYLLANFDTDKDGKISLEEALEVKEINCSGKEIKDLTGIEKFLNLESLDCSNNKLYDIEVQKNKKLIKLDCRKNNNGFQIYFSASSPLKNPEYQIPAEGGPPENANSMINPIDNSKCLYDEGTLVMILFNE